MEDVKPLILVRRGVAPGKQAEKRGEAQPGVIGYQYYPGAGPLSIFENLYSVPARRSGYILAWKQSG